MSVPGRRHNVDDVVGLFSGDGGLVLDRGSRWRRWIAVSGVRMRRQNKVGICRRPAGIRRRSMSTMVEIRVVNRDAVVIRVVDRDTVDGQVDLAVT